MRKTAAALVIFFILASFVPASAFTITYNGITEDYPWDPIVMVVDGVTVETEEMPPIILNGRTLVPAREFFEQLGADVTWVQSTQRVIIDYNDTRIVMEIGSRSVTVGNLSVEIASEDPAPTIINDKTMIPVRFVAESLGFEVEWINETRTVNITSPSVNNVQITKIKFLEKSYGDVIRIYMNEYAAPSIFQMENPARVVIDFYGAEATIDDGTISADGDCVEQVRYSQHTDKFRIVADVSCPVEISYEETSRGMDILIERTGDDYDENETGTDDEDSSEPTEPATQGTSGGDYSAFTVVVDAGHGGSDPGAIYPVDSSNPTIREKDITLDIALKVRDNLLAYGVNVIMTRDSDTYPTLQERAEIANNANADLFVSIHCNSIENKDSIDGAQVYYHGSSEFGKTFAQIVYDNIIAYTGMTERGIQDGSSLYVIRNTTMPAILTEGGFVSNEDDRNYLLSESGRQAIANAISDGIIEALGLL